MNQKNAILGCLIAPVALYFGLNYLQGPKLAKSTEESSKTLMNAIPSSEQIAEIVRAELAKREATVRPVIISLTASQLGVVVFGGLAASCLVYLVIKNNKNNNNSILTSKY